MPVRPVSSVSWAPAAAAMYSGSILLATLRCSGTYMWLSPPYLLNSSYKLADCIWVRFPVCCLKSIAVCDGMATALTSEPDGAGGAVY